MAPNKKEFTFTDTVESPVGAPIVVVTTNCVGLVPVTPPES